MSPPARWPAVVRDIAYLVFLTGAWFSALVLVAAFDDPSAHPVAHALSLEPVLQKVVAAAALLGAGAIVLLRPEKRRVLLVLRRVLVFPVAGGRLRMALFMVALGGLAVVLQVPVLRTSRIRVQACGDDVRLCRGATACVEELVRVPAGKGGDVRVSRGDALVAVTGDGAIVWSGRATGSSYAAPAVAVDACFRTRFEVDCRSDAIDVFVHNESDRTLSIFGFSVSPVYSAVYPQVAARVAPVPTYDPLEIDLSNPTVQGTRAPALVEVPKRDTGLVTIPLVLKRPDPKAIYVSGARLCVKLGLTAPPRCLEDAVLIMEASPTAVRCKVLSDAALRDEIVAGLARKQLPTTDLVKLYAELHMEDAERMVIEAFDGTVATDIALRLDLLDVMASLTGPTSLARLVAVEASATASSSERVRALVSHARRDSTHDKTAVLLRWATEADADLASRALQLLPASDVPAACEQRLAAARCDDAMFWLHCGTLGDPILVDVLQRWREACP